MAKNNKGLWDDIPCTLVVGQTIYAQHYRFKVVRTGPTFKSVVLEWKDWNTNAPMRASFDYVQQYFEPPADWPIVLDDEFRWHLNGECGQKNWSDCKKSLAEFGHASSR